MATILLSGGTGFLGQELGIALTRLGHTITVLTREPTKHQGRMAFPCAFAKWSDNLNDLVGQHGVIINLNGSSIISTPWTAAGKKEILDSRLLPTKKLVDACNKQSEAKIFLQASAVGYYGDRGNEELAESSSAGTTGFLADTCKAWEKEAGNLDQIKHRLCVFRIGPILGMGGGMLKELDAIYGSGAGSVLGDGKQYVPWIHIDDICRMFVSAIEDTKFKGGFNACAPDPITYKEFHNTLKKIRNAITLPPAPKIVLKCVLGERAAVLLSSQRAFPQRLQDIGFKFLHTNIMGALKDIYSCQKRSNCLWVYKKQWVPKSRTELWPFFSKETNLEALTPAFLNFKVKSKSTDTIRKDTQIKYRLSLHGIPMGWTSLICEWQPERYFVDTQLKGPYSFWYHEHIFEDLAGGTLLIDRVQYRVPLGELGQAVSGWLIRKDINTIFSYRNKIIAETFKP